MEYLLFLLKETMDGQKCKLLKIVAILLNEGIMTNTCNF
jgi:hypothetical protein